MFIIVRGSTADELHNWQSHRFGQRVWMPTM